MSEASKITIHWGSGSPFAWRALLALELKRVPYESRLLEFSKGDTRSDAFRQLNPRGKVPVLVDGETIVYESLAIVSYLDRRFPEPPLFGTTPVEHGKVWQRVFELENYMRSAVSAATTPIFTGKIDREAIAEATKALHVELERVAGWLEGSSWLAGDRVSAADIVAYPGVMIIERAYSKPIAAEHGITAPDTSWWKTLTAWRDRFAALPGVENTYPPHWRTS